MVQSPVAKPKRRRAVWILLALLTAAAIGICWVYREAGAVPQFYAESLQRQLPPESSRRMVDVLERDVLHVQNQMRQAGAWQVTLKDDQINAWLATQLAQKMPKLLPADIKEPRLALRDKAILLACRYEGAMPGVLSVELEPSLTDHANELAIRVKAVRFGRVPIPQQPYLDQVAKEIQKAGVSLRWIDDHGEAVAIVNIPTESDQLPGRKILVQTVSIIDNTLTIAGTAKYESPTKRP